MEELTLNTIDFKWVDETEDPKKLRKAIKLLKEDGGHFPELEKHINKKLSEVDRKFQ
jgi:hypothetical protein